MSTKTFALTCVVALLLSKHAFSAQLDVWCADDMVKIDPTSGKIHEADETKASDRPNGDYRIKNSIWDRKTIHLGRISASTKASLPRS